MTLKTRSRYHSLSVSNCCQYFKSFPIPSITMISPVCTTPMKRKEANQSKMKVAVGSVVTVKVGEMEEI